MPERQKYDSPTNLIIEKPLSKDFIAGADAEFVCYGPRSRKRNKLAGGRFAAQEAALSTPSREDHIAGIQESLVLQCDALLMDTLGRSFCGHVLSPTGGSNKITHPPCPFVRPGVGVRDPRKIKVQDLHSAEIADIEDLSDRVKRMLEQEKIVNLDQLLGHNHDIVRQLMSRKGVGRGTLQEIGEALASLGYAITRV